MSSVIYNYTKKQETDYTTVTTHTSYYINYILPPLTICSTFGTQRTSLLYISNGDTMMVYNNVPTLMND